MAQAVHLQLRISVWISGVREREREREEGEVRASERTCVCAGKVRVQEQAVCGITLPPSPALPARPPTATFRGWVKTLWRVRQLTTRITVPLLCNLMWVTCVCVCVWVVCGRYRSARVPFVKHSLFVRVCISSLRIRMLSAVRWAVVTYRQAQRGGGGVYLVSVCICFFVRSAACSDIVCVLVYWKHRCIRVHIARQMHTCIFFAASSVVCVVSVVRGH